MANMTFTDDEIEMSAAQVTIGGTDVGGILGGVVFTYTVGIQKVFVDQSSMPRKHFITQEEAQMVIPMAEYSFDNLMFAFPTGTRVNDSGGIKKKISMGGAQIDTDNDYAEIIAYAIIGGSGTIETDTNLKITIFKAIAISNQEIGYTKDNVRVIAVTFDAKADSSLTAGAQLFLIGDATAAA